MTKPNQRVSIFILVSLLSLASYHWLTSIRHRVIWGKGDVSSFEIEHTKLTSQAILTRWRNGRKKFDQANRPTQPNTQPLPEFTYDEFLVIDTTNGSIQIQRNDTPLPGYQFHLAKGINHRLYRTTPNGIEQLKGVIRLRHRGADKNYQEMFWILGEGRGVGIGLGFAYHKTINGSQNKSDATIPTPKFGKQLTGMSRSSSSSSGPAPPPPPIRYRIKNGKPIPIKSPPAPQDPFDSAIVTEDEYIAHRKQVTTNTATHPQWLSQTDSQLDTDHATHLASIAPIFKLVQQDLNKNNLQGDLRFTHNPAFTAMNISGIVKSKSTLFSRLPFISNFATSKRFNMNLQIDQIEPNTWYAHSETPTRGSALSSIKLLPQNFTIHTDTATTTNSQESINKGQAFLKALHQIHWQIQIDENTRLILHGITQAREPNDTWWGPDGQPLQHLPINLPHPSSSYRNSDKTFYIAWAIDSPQQRSYARPKIEPHPRSNFPAQISARYTTHTSSPQNQPRSQAHYVQFKSPLKKFNLILNIEIDNTEIIKTVRLENISLTPGQNFDFKMILEPQSP